MNLPAAFASLEEKAAFLAKEAKTILGELPASTLATLEKEVETGVSVLFPQLAPIIPEIGPLVGELETVARLIEAVTAIKAVPVTPA